MNTIILVSLGIYFLPTFISILNKKSDTKMIFLGNLFLGWTIIFWLSFLVWSFVNTKDKSIDHVGNYSNYNDDSELESESTSKRTGFSKFISIDPLIIWYRNLK
jgi:hypothetical protein